MKLILFIATFMAVPFVIASQKPADQTSRDIDMVHQASELIGSKVIGIKGDSLGKIKDLVFTRNGQISFFVLVSGGMLGFNETKTLVSWNLLNIQGGQSHPQEPGIIAKVSKAELTAAPKLTTRELDQIANPSLKERIDKYYITSSKEISDDSTKVTSSQWMHKFNQLDNNSDGMLNKKEASAGSNSGLAAQFSEADSNSDGKLSRGEFSKYKIRHNNPVKD